VLSAIAEGYEHWRRRVTGEVPVVPKKFHK
jgi:hypothetical protein